MASPCSNNRTPCRSVTAAATLVLAALVLLAGVGCHSSADESVGGGAAGAAGGDVAVVVDVVDGDTIHVELSGGVVETVRLLGIDTPESVDPNRPVECHGPEAALLLAELLPAGTSVRLERDEEARDHYGRLLAYVFREPDGAFVNRALLDAGEAERLEIPPNTAYRSVLEPAAAAARAAGAGLWGDCPERPPSGDRGL